MTLLQDLNETTKDKYINLKPNTTTILEGGGNDYQNGLRVKLLEDGGYEIEYWYEDSTKATPIEVEVDGKSVKKDAKMVTMLFHPDLP